MKVLAAKGLKCPMEGRPRSYITDSEPVEVPESCYYGRLIRTGSLVRAGGDNGTNPAQKPKGGGK